MAAMFLYTSCNKDFSSLKDRKCLSHRVNNVDAFQLHAWIVVTKLLGLQLPINKGTLLNESTLAIDAELLTRISNDDQAAFEELYRRYWRRCYMQVLRRSGDAMLAEDITQSVFVSLWEKRKSVTIQHIGAYLFSAVRFRFINYLKSQLHEETYTVHLLRGQHDAHDQNPVEVSMHIRELNEAIDKGVAMMPPKTKAIYTLSRTEHYSVKEIANKLNLSEKSVEYHITHSLKTLRPALNACLALGQFFPQFFWLNF